MDSLDAGRCKSTRQSSRCGTVHTSLDQDIVQLVAGASFETQHSILLHHCMGLHTHRQATPLQSHSHLHLSSSLYPIEHADKLRVVRGERSYLTSDDQRSLLTSRTCFHNVALSSFNKVTIVSLQVCDVVNQLSSSYLSSRATSDTARPPLRPLIIFACVC